MKCEVCKGSKTNTVTIHTFGSDKVDKMELTCVHCDGSGEMSQDEIDHHNWSKDQWCKCKGRTPTTYIPDNVSPICSKHHWVCDECAKITQIG